MVSFVTLEQAKAYCRVMHDDEDDVFNLLIEAASDAVLDTASQWVNDLDPDWNGETGALLWVTPENAPARIKLAVLARVASSYDNRESIEASKGENAMLQPLRKLEV